jgi:hypothetical protein
LNSQLRACLSACLVLLAPLTPRAAEQPGQAAPDGWAEAAELFDLYCLQRYPDFDAMVALARQRGDVSLSAAGMPDPGKVWATSGPSGRAIIRATVKPNGGCSVQRVVAARPFSIAPLTRVLATYKKVHRLTLKGSGPLLLPGQMNVEDLTAVDPAGRQTGTFSIATMHYDDHLPHPMAGIDGTDGGWTVIFGRDGATMPWPPP